MAEVVFPCYCGLILKVYGDDQVGEGIVCPSCGSTIIVPAVGIDHEAPASVGLDKPTATGKWFGIAYLAVICVLTLGLIKFVLMPALAVPVAVAQNDSPKTQEPKETLKDIPPESHEGPRRLLKKRPIAVSRAPLDEEDPAPTKRSSRRTRIASTAPRTSPAAPATDETETPDEPETPPRPEPIGPFGTLPTGPFGELAKELRDRVPPGLEAGSRISKKSAAKKSPYEDIANKEARQALEHAVKNTTDLLATAAAESFLTIAEKASDGDPKVMAEIEKIRHKIAKIRNEE
jgi:DNA-directed RNA polymerase subunit RPC12/RpoP